MESSSNYCGYVTVTLIIFVILFAYTVMTNRITKATEGAFE